MGDKPTGHCKGCLEEVVRVFSHIQQPSGNYIYRDDHGRMWKGSTCPPCQARIKRERYKHRKTIAVESPGSPISVTQDIKVDKDSSIK